MTIKLKLFLLIIILFSIFLSLPVSAKTIANTVPPEGGSGYIQWQYPEGKYTLRGNFSTRQGKCFDCIATTPFDKFEGDFRDNKVTWMIEKGIYYKLNDQKTKFYIDNTAVTVCANHYDCSYVTKATVDGIDVELRIYGIENARNELINILEFRREREEKEKQKKEKKKEPKVIVKNEDGDIDLIGVGSGFFINGSGNIITNYHVISACVEVMYGDEKLSVSTFDMQNDLAILKSKKSNKSFINIRNNKVLAGEDVYVIGYPFGKDLSTSSKITRGIVTAIQGIGNDYSRFQIDAPIQPGNSGGPVLDGKGQLIGVAVSKADTDAFIEIYGVIPENMNFAIKTSALLNMLDAHDIKSNEALTMNVMSGSEIFAKNDPAVVYLECYGYQ